MNSISYLYGCLLLPNGPLLIFVFIHYTKAATKHKNTPCGKCFAAINILWLLTCMHSFSGPEKYTESCPARCVDYVARTNISSQIQPRQVFQRPWVQSTRRRSFHCGCASQSSRKIKSHMSFLLRLPRIYFFLWYLLYLSLPVSSLPVLIWNRLPTSSPTHTYNCNYFKK